MKRPPAVHPLLFAIFPVLFLFSHNVSQAAPIETLRPALISVCFASVLWLISSLAMRSARKAAILVSLFLLLFFSYGHLCAIAERRALTVAGIAIGGRIILSLDIVLFGFAAYAVLKARGDVRTLTAAFNLAGAFLVALPAAVAAYALLSSPGPRAPVQMPAAAVRKLHKRPDIYYIILDGYGRSDTLKSMYDYDNGEFLAYLRRKGFYVAENSKANYCQTLLSLASSLNLAYLDDLADRLGAESQDRRPLSAAVRSSYVSSFLRERGYVLAAFSSGYSGTEVRSADIYLSPPRVLTEFDNVLINTTPIPDIESRLIGSRFFPRLWSRWQYDSHRRRIRYIFQRLGRMTEIARPMFVFAHIVAPHPPFVFGAHEEPTEPEATFGFGDGSHLRMQRSKYAAKYRAQVAFINEKMRQTIDRIISSSPEPPVVIIQADHGPGSMLDWEKPGATNFKERMSILNAYYLPDNADKKLYPEISPVNTFRMVFNHCFGTSYRLLKDESYFSTWTRPYKFIKVTTE